VSMTSVTNGKTFSTKFFYIFCLDAIQKRCTYVAKFFT